MKSSASDTDPRPRSRPPSAGRPAEAAQPQRGPRQAALTGVVHGWPCAAAPDTQETPPVSVTLPDPATPGTYAYGVADLDAPLGGLPPASAACAVLADLSVAFCRALPGGIGLHCGAVVIGGRLVLILGGHRAGKSTLVARLGAEPGVSVIGDDVLPVTAGGEALALGLSPRLRLPLPAGIGPALPRALARHGAAADDRYAFFRPPGLLPFGTRMRPGAVVLLRRGAPGTPARLHHLPQAEAVRVLVGQALTGLGPPEEALDRVGRLVAGLPAMTLCYSDLDGAAHLLAGGFARGGVPAADPAPAAPAPAPAADPPADPDAALRCARGLALRLAEGGAFLWRAGETRLWHLNAMARALWVLAEDAGPSGLTPRDAARALEALFPDTKGAVILEDACAAFGGFLAQGFVEAAG